MDASTAMLEQARRRFAGHPAVSFAVADMAAAALGGSWDVVASALAIHHLDAAAKQALFRFFHEAAPTGIYTVTVHDALPI